MPRPVQIQLPNPIISESINVRRIGRGIRLDGFWLRRVLRPNVAPLRGRKPLAIGSTGIKP